MIFDHWTYNQFYMERTSWSAQQKAPIHFTVEEIEWAVAQTEYKYFGCYEFTDQQEIAMEILVWCARQQLIQKPQEHTYTGTGSDYLDCVLGVGGFESFGPIDK